MREQVGKVRVSSEGAHHDHGRESNPGGDPNGLTEGRKLQWLVIPPDAGAPNFNRIETLWVLAFAGMTWEKAGKPCGMQA